ncbi:hypothetical protein J2S00_001884 [Caldalkalibacillus uzonensis]|uniref:Uncharacterized protein n=1 Tax=Caldalkalibacillus uzonensis TaxID=353224 RepID=A0ABU0CRP7_9BACI|nr:hypothetical protein [Caldalkalibacillus uzonensis]MDQ0339098.1 hypothetical protein [Caldalkalibacillus uzonensis]
MTFKPYNPSLIERFDLLSAGFAGLILLLSAILSWGIISDNGLDMTVRPDASTQVVNEDSDHFKSPYILEVRTRTSEEASLELKVRCEEVNIPLEAAPAQVTVPGMETYKDVIFIIPATGDVPEGRWPIWIDAYAEGEVIASVKTIFYNQHTQP